MADDINDNNDNNDTQVVDQNTPDAANPPADPPADPPATPPADQDTGDTGDNEDGENGDSTAEFDPADWYGETDERSDHADSVFEILHTSGVSQDEAKALLFDAVQSGKPEDIDINALTEKVGKANAHLIITGVKAYVADAEAKVNAITEIVHSAAGGKDSWNDKVIPWIKDNIPEDERGEYADMINAGGRQAELAAAEMVRRYNADPKNTSLGRKELRGDANNSKKTEPGLSQRAYGDALNKLHRTNQATPEKLAELRAARRRGRAQGL